ncbi:MAG: hypothetical protein KAJ65_01600 [Gammaproteobacteria bacterium]|nr:hypothetical protein [Gammaproteobacteria bacterium]
MLTEPVVLLLIAAVIVVFISLIWPRKKHRHGNKKAKYLARLRNSGQYWGVTIRNGNCSASRRMCGRGFRLAEAPSLPIPGCRSLRCACIYTGLRERRLKERRSNQDRRTEVRLGSAQPERRRMRDRRSSFHS